MITAILFLLVLSIFVFVHELGNFSIAKLFKVRVDEFAIGFPPRIFSFKKGETEYSLNALPLGGYVKIHGENPGAEDDKNDKRNFQNISWWKQVLVLVAGVVFNILFAWFLMSLSLFIGTNKIALDGVDQKYIKGDNHVLIHQVLKDSPAEKAGIKPGSYVVSIDNQDTKTVEDVQLGIKNAPKDFNIVLADSKSATTSINLKKTNDNTIGVALASVGKVQMGVFPSIWYGAKATIGLTYQIFDGVINFFGKLFVGKGSWDEVSGPVGIAKVVGTSSEEGFISLLFITMLISISLAAMNILPFPALDGGRIVIALIEGLTRKKIPLKIVNALNSFGFVLLLILMLVVTFKDIF